jgi:uncharacterized protein with HEPN domain
MTPRDRAALERIIECAQAVNAYSARAGVDWATDDMAVDAIAKRIEEIGEVAKRLTPELLAAMPTVNWKGVKGMREVMAHDYDQVSVDVLASIVRDNLPGLHVAVARKLASEQPPVPPL